MIRRCENPECPNGSEPGVSADISNLKATARYCGSGCRARAWELRNPPESPEVPFVAVRGLSPKQALCLKLLKDAGGEGVTTSDFLRAGCGSRFGGRIHELRGAGYVIEAERERQGSHRYRLVTDLLAGKEPSQEPNGSGAEIPRRAGTTSTGASNPGAPGGQLFDVSTTHRPLNAALADPEQ